MVKRRIFKRQEAISSVIEKKVTFNDAYEYFLTAKKSEGMRDKTVKTYKEHFHFFHNWLKDNHQDIKHIDEIDASLIRQYIVYMRDDHYNYKTKENGLSPMTINASLVLEDCKKKKLERDKTIRQCVNELI